MLFTKIVPGIFYTDIRIALKTFIDCLEFTIGHEELNTGNPFCVVDKDGLSIMLWGAREFAMLDGQIGIRLQEWPIG